MDWCCISRWCGMLLHSHAAAAADYWLLDVTDTEQSKNLLQSELTIHSDWPRTQKPGRHSEHRPRGQRRSLTSWSVNGSTAQSTKRGGSKLQDTDILTANITHTDTRGFWKMFNNWTTGSDVFPWNHFFKFGNCYGSPTLLSHGMCGCWMLTTTTLFWLK